MWRQSIMAKMAKASAIRRRKYLAYQAKANENGIEMLSAANGQHERRINGGWHLAAWRIAGG
jgi:hypothetical protein